MHKRYSLHNGDEVDYNCIDDYWVTARVEEVACEGAVLHVRFQTGVEDVVHKVDLRLAGDAARIAPAGYHAVPLMVDQPVDVLRSLPASDHLGASEQWLRGTVIAARLGHDAHSSSAAKVHSSRLAHSATQEDVGAATVAVRITSRGDAVLGLTYGVPRDASSGAPCSPPDGGIVLTDLLALAPPGSYAGWVPSTADITPVLAGLSSPVGTRDLSSRGHAVFRGSPSVCGRMVLAGRAGLLDFDLVDVLPRPQRTAHAAQRPSSAILLSRALRRQQLDATAAAAVAAPLATHTRRRRGSSVIARGGAGNTGGSSSGAGAAATLSSAIPPSRRNSHSGEVAATTVYALVDADLPYSGSGALTETAEAAAGREFAGSLTATASPSALISTSKRSASTAPSVTSSAAAAAAASGTVPWRLAIVKWLPTPPSSATGAATGAPAAAVQPHQQQNRGGSDPVTTAAAAAAAADSNWTTTVPSPSSEGTTSANNKHATKSHGASVEGSVAAAAAATGASGGGGGAFTCFAFWYEPAYTTAVCGSGGGQALHIVPRLCCSPISALSAVAPPGLHSIPYVPGQRVEVRRMGGLWTVGTVVAADREAVAVRVKRVLPPALDRNAVKVRAVPVFDKRASKLRVATFPPLAAAAAPAHAKSRSSSSAGRRGDSTHSSGGGGNSAVVTKKPAVVQNSGGSSSSSSSRHRDTRGDSSGTLSTPLSSASITPLDGHTSTHTQQSQQYSQEYSPQDAAAAHTQQSQQQQQQQLLSGRSNSSGSGSGSGSRSQQQRLDSASSFSTPVDEVQQSGDAAAPHGEEASSILPVPSSSSTSSLSSSSAAGGADTADDAAAAAAARSARAQRVMRATGDKVALLRAEFEGKKTANTGTAASSSSSVGIIGLAPSGSGGGGGATNNNTLRKGSFAGSVSDHINAHSTAIAAAAAAAAGQRSRSNSNAATGAAAATTSAPATAAASAVPASRLTRLPTILSEGAFATFSTPTSSPVPHAAAAAEGGAAGGFFNDDDGDLDVVEQELQGGRSTHPTSTSAGGMHSASAAPIPASRPSHRTRSGSFSDSLDVRKSTSGLHSGSGIAATAAGAGEAATAPSAGTAPAPRRASISHSHSPSPPHSHSHDDVHCVLVTIVANGVAAALAGTPDTDVLPAHMWRYLLARPGHYCFAAPRDHKTAAPAHTPHATAVPATAAGGGAAAAASAVSAAVSVANGSDSRGALHLQLGPSSPSAVGGGGVSGAATPPLPPAAAAAAAAAPSSAPSARGGGLLGFFGWGSKGSSRGGGGGGGVSPSNAIVVDFAPTRSPRDGIVGVSSSADGSPRKLKGTAAAAATAATAAGTAAPSISSAVSASAGGSSSSGLDFGGAALHAHHHCPPMPESDSTAISTSAAIGVVDAAASYPPPVVPKKKSAVAAAMEDTQKSVQSGSMEWHGEGRYRGRSVLEEMFQT